MVSNEYETKLNVKTFSTSIISITANNRKEHGNFRNVFDLSIGTTSTILVATTVVDPAWWLVHQRDLKGRQDKLP